MDKLKSEEKSRKVETSRKAAQKKQVEEKYRKSKKKAKKQSRGLLMATNQPGSVLLGCPWSADRRPCITSANTTPTFAMLVLKVPTVKGPSVSPGGGALDYLWTLEGKPALRCV